MLSEQQRKAEEKMNKALDVLRKEFATLRTGRASLGILEGIMVDYYGTPTPLNQVANMAIPDPRQITIQPWEPKMLGEIVARDDLRDLGGSCVVDDDRPDRRGRERVEHALEPTPAEMRRDDDGCGPHPLTTRCDAGCARSAHHRYRAGRARCRRAEQRAPSVRFPGRTPSRGMTLSSARTPVPGECGGR